ncbi:thioesterase domain-containing protein [Nonomuraea sp. NPDC049129]|uniref:thioesterase II family protein n=1 Tax=Nonomuraea sp. NPDC049129 TaxID=3155272 RepID=UPI00340E4ED2
MTVNDVTSEDAIQRWLPFRAQTGAAADALALFCLPHAGGGASAYRAWQHRLPGVAVLPVQPAGRENRLREPPYERMAPLVADLADVILAEVSGGRRYAVYGHSLGALVSFELLREIRRRGGPAPVHLFVSGCVAPHRSFDDGPPVRGMSSSELVELLRKLGGTPDWLLNDPSVLEMILPAMQADFSVKETYTYYPEPPLDVPITALPSTDDPRAGRELVAAWREQTTGRFDLHTYVGGHFAVFEQAKLTYKHVSEALRAWV